MTTLNASIGKVYSFGTIGEQYQIDVVTEEVETTEVELTEEEEIIYCTLIDEYVRQGEEVTGINHLIKEHFDGLAKSEMAGHLRELHNKGYIDYDGYYGTIAVM